LKAEKIAEKRETGRLEGRKLSSISAFSLPAFAFI